MDKIFLKSYVKVMIYIFLSIAFFISVGKQLFAQDTSAENSLILTCQRNSMWLDSLKKLPLQYQINAIKERVVQDTNVFIIKPLPDGIQKIDKPLNGAYKGCCKPEYNLGGYVIMLDSYAKRNIHFFLEVIKSIKIDRIEVLNDDSNKDIAIYGTNGACGVVVFVIKDKKSLRIVKRLQRKMNSDYTIR